MIFVAEGGSVWVSVVPSLRGFGTKMQSALKSEDLSVLVGAKMDRKQVKAEADAATKGVGATIELDADIAKVKTAIRETEANLADLRRKAAADTPQLDLDIRAAEAKSAKITADLERLRTLDASPEIDLKIATAEQQLGRVNAQLDELRSKKVTPEVDLQITKAMADLDRFKVELDRLSVERANIPVDVDTGGATTKLMAFRTLAQGTFRDALHMNVDVDTGGAIVKINALKGLLGSLAMPAAIVAGTPYLLSLGASAVQAAGGIALLPAVLTAGGLALGALKMATSGVGKALGDAMDPTKAKELAKDLQALPAPAREFVTSVAGIKPQLDALKSGVSGAFFADMGRDETSLARIYLPMLSGALVPIAVGFNQVEGEMAGWLQTAQGQATVGVLFNNTSIAVVNLVGTFAPLLQAFLQIGAIGAPILANLTTGAGGAAYAFSQWTQSAAGIQTIRGWILGAIGVFQQLWSVAMNVGSILGSLFAGGQRSGESFLGMLVRITGTMATALKTPEGAAQLDGVLTGIRDVVGMLWDKLVILWPALAASGQAFLDLMQAASPITNLLYSILVPAVQIVALGLSALSPVLGPLIGLWIAWNVVLAIWTAILDANPIVLIVLALAALVGGVIYAYQNFAWFRDIVQGAWLAIQVAATFAWTFLQQVFAALGTAITAVGGFFVWLWQTVVVPAWNAISAAISWAWNTVMLPILTAIGTVIAVLGAILFTILVTPFVIAWNIISAALIAFWGTVCQPIFNQISVGLTILGAAFNWFWSAVIVPVWNGITAAITAAWTWIDANVFTPIKIGLQLVGIGFTILWNSYVVPAWNGIVAAATAAWNWVNNNVFTPFKTGLTVVGQFFVMLWNNYVVPAWNGIQAAASAAWNFVNNNVFAPFKTGVQAVGQAFQNVADFIGRAWDTIREATRRPVQWVVDVVYNNGIRAVWNDIAGLFGMAQLPAVNMATGGVLPGYSPGRDYIPAMLSGGEGILVPEAVRGLGPAFVGWANRTFSGGRSDGGPGTGGASGFARGGVARFAQGGVVQNFAGGGIVDFITGAGSSVINFMMNAITDATGAVKALFASVVGSANATPGGGQPWTEALKKIPGKTIDAVIEKVKAWVASLGSMGAGGNWAPVALQALMLAGQSASNLGRVLAQIQIESGGNPNAINLTDVNARAGHPSQGLLQTIPSTFAAYAGPFRGLGITNPLANIYAGIKYAVARYGSLAIWPTRGGYAQGGIVPGVSGTGDSVSAMLTPGERVLTVRQTAAFESLMPMLSRMQSSGSLSPGDFGTAGRYGASGGITIVVNPSERMDEGQLADAVQHRLDWQMGLINS